MIKKIPIGLLLLSIGGALLFFILKGKEISIHPNIPSLEYVFVPGEVRTYNFTQITTIKFGNNSSLSGFKISGSLIEKVYQVQSDFILLGVSLGNPALNLDNSKNSETLKKDLTKEIYLKITPKREIINFFFPNSSSTEANNILKNIMAATQIILPEVIHSKEDFSYQLTELNMNGPFQAEYNIIYDKEISIHKKFLKYDFIGFKDIPESEIIFLPDSKSISIFKMGLLQKVDHLENSLIDSSGIQIQSSVKTHLSLRTNEYFKIKLIPSIEDKNLFYMTTLYGGEINPKEKISSLKNIVGSIKAEDIFENFKNLDFEKQGMEAYNNFRKLKAILELYPNQISKVIEQIESLNPDDPFYENLLSVYFGAISTMESKFAQDELMDIIQKFQDPSIQIQAFGALADLGHPTKKTQEFLIDYYHSSSSSESKSLAALSLGTLAYMSKNNSPKLMKDTTNFLKEELIQAQKKEDVLTFLSAIGNSGDIKLLQTLTPYMKLDDKDISSSAILAMENMAGEKVDLIVKNLLENNFTKENALYVLSKSPSSINQMNMAKSFFENETNSNLKIMALKIISTNSKFFKKEVKDYLEKVQSSDIDSKVKESATDLILSL